MTGGGRKRTGCFRRSKSKTGHSREVAAQPIALTGRGGFSPRPPAYRSGTSTRSRSRQNLERQRMPPASPSPRGLAHDEDAGMERGIGRRPVRSASSFDEALVVEVDKARNHVVLGAAPAIKNKPLWQCTWSGAMRDEAAAANLHQRSGAELRTSLPLDCALKSGLQLIDVVLCNGREL